MAQQHEVNRKASHSGQDETAHNPIGRRKFLLPSWEEAAHLAEDYLARPIPQLPDTRLLLHALGRGAVADEAMARLEVSCYNAHQARWHKC